MRTVTSVAGGAVIAKGGKILIKSLGPIAETALAKAAKKFVRNEFGGIRLPKFVKSKYAKKADEIRSTSGGAVGKTFDVENGGKVFVEGAPANLHELGLAVEIASEMGKTITIKGGSSATGDYLIDGISWEVKSLIGNSASTVQNSIEQAVGQATRNIIIDGRKTGVFSGISKGTGITAIERWVSSSAFDPLRVITVFTKGGRIRYIPGKGVIKN